MILAGNEVAELVENPVVRKMMFVVNPGHATAEQDGGGVVRNRRRVRVGLLDDFGRPVRKPDNNWNVAGTLVCNVRRESVERVASMLQELRSNRKVFNRVARQRHLGERN